MAESFRDVEERDERTWTITRRWVRALGFPRELEQAIDGPDTDSVVVMPVVECERRVAALQAERDLSRGDENKSTTTKSVAALEQRVEELADLASELMDQLVERWHSDYKGDLPLHEFMGLTWEQYKVWVEDASALPVLASGEAGGEACDRREPSSFGLDSGGGNQ